MNPDYYTEYVVTPSRIIKIKREYDSSRPSYITFEMGAFVTPAIAWVMLYKRSVLSPGKTRIKMICYAYTNVTWQEPLIRYLAFKRF